MNGQHPHWSVYVSCAVLTTGAVFLLTISDVQAQRDLGRWGIAAALGAAVMACIAVAHRYAFNLRESTHEEVEHAVEDIDDLLNAKTAAVIAAYGEQTEEIAEAVCTAVVRVVARNGGPTPLRR